MKTKPVTHEDLEHRRKSMGFWQLYFDNGYLKLEMPKIFDAAEIKGLSDSLNHIVDQVTRWSADWAVDRAELDGTIGMGEGI